MLLVRRKERREREREEGRQGRRQNGIARRQSYARIDSQRERLAREREFCVSRGII